jgi:hypothetical protein
LKNTHHFDGLTVKYLNFASGLMENYSTSDSKYKYDDNLYTLNEQIRDGYASDSDLNKRSRDDQNKSCHYKRKTAGIC